MNDKIFESILKRLENKNGSFDVECIFIKTRTGLGLQISLDEMTYIPGSGFIEFISDIECTNFLPISEIAMIST